MAESLPVSLLEDLHAAAAVCAGSGIHFDACSVYDPDRPDFGCSCGIPGLLRALAELLPLPAGAAQPYRPAWVPSARVA